MLGRALLMGVLLAGLPSPAEAGEGCTGQRVTPALDVAAIVRSAPEGATICFAPGTYRLEAPLQPRAGQRLVGAPGAVLTGAFPVTGFEPHGRLWRAPIVGAAGSGRGVCQRGWDGCTYPEVVAYGGRPLRRVMSAAAVEPGRFALDAQGGWLWIADDPAAAPVTLSVSSGAVAAWNAPGVEVTGFVVELFATTAGTGALRGRAMEIGGNEVRFNHGAGIQAWDGSQVIGNYVHHNGQIGVVGQGPGIVVEGNLIAHNNTAGFDPVWEAGGTKWVDTEGLVVRGNVSVHNRGPGLWLDLYNRASVVEGNIVRGNEGPGIFVELSYGARLRGNLVRSNGRRYTAWSPAGVLVVDSSGVTITGNALARNRAGVVLIQDDRQTGPYGPTRLRHIAVRGNRIAMARGITGMQDWTSGCSCFSDPTIVFAANRFEVPRAARLFEWRGRRLTLAGWEVLGLG